LPDGSGLLVAGLDTDSFLGQIWFVSYPKGEISRFTNDLADYANCCLEVTRDGHSLVTLQDTHLSDLWIAKGDGSEAKQITNGQNLGFELLWVGGSLGATNLRSQWFQAGADNGQISPFFNDHELRFQISACPDGKRIVYATSHNATVELWSSDTEGNNAAKISAKPLFATGICSPDSKSVIYAAEDAIWRSPIAGGAAEKTDLPLAEFGFSRDGKQMFYTSQQIEGSLHAKFVVTPANDSKTVLHELDIPYGMRAPRFTPDGQAIAFLLNRNRATNIWELPLSGGAPVQLTKFMSGDMFAFSWSRDGKQLAFSHGQIKTDVVMMSNFR